MTPRAKDELIDSLSLLDMARLHRLVTVDTSIGEGDIERALVQVQRSLDDAASAYKKWLRGQNGLHRATVARLTGLLAQPPLIPLGEVQ